MSALLHKASGFARQLCMDLLNFKGIESTVCGSKNKCFTSLGYLGEALCCICGQFIALVRENGEN